ncbi:MAG: HIT domain-containing protein [Rhizobacter sp.]|nr:HIT domain-containing protein [Chlorobiales bacterium]
MDKMFSPWRSQYIASFKERNKPKDGKSIFAGIPPEEDETRLVVHRGAHCFIIMNLYPYNSGHLMVIPYQQTADFSELNDSTKLELMQLSELAMAALKKVMSPDGFNLGMNLGQVAGGSVDTHLHLHVVPRWQGDTNFMPVTAETKVISDDMTKTYHALKSAIAELKAK